MHDQPTEPPKKVFFSIPMGWAEMKPEDRQAYARDIAKAHPGRGSSRRDAAQALTRRARRAGLDRRGATIQAVSRRQRRHPEQHAWDDFSVGGFVSGWRNPHRTWRGHSVFWAVGVAVAFVVVVVVVVGIVVEVVGHVVGG